MVVCIERIPEGFLPLCKLADRQPFSGARNIDISSLVVIRLDCAQDILDISIKGYNTVDKMQKYINSKSCDKLLKKKIEKVLPIVQEIELVYDVQEMYIMRVWNIEAMTGYKPITTFWNDFSIADNFGIEAIQDTYNRAFKEWKGNYKYLTELVMVLNHKIWAWYGRNNNYAELYDKLWRMADEYAVTHLKGDKLKYFYRVTD